MPPLPYSGLLTKPEVNRLVRYEQPDAIADPRVLHKKTVASRFITTKSFTTLPPFSDACGVGPVNCAIRTGDVALSGPRRVLYSSMAERSRGCNFVRSHEGRAGSTNTWRAHLTTYDRSRIRRRFRRLLPTQWAVRVRKEVLSRACSCRLPPFGQSRSSLGRCCRRQQQRTLSQQQLARQTDQ